MMFIAGAACVASMVGLCASSVVAAPQHRAKAAQAVQRSVASLKLSGLAHGMSNCSRSTPVSTGFWEVPEADVERVDKALVRFIRSSGLSLRLPFAVADYVRQYVGLERGAKRLVYVNALHGKSKAAIVRRANDEFLRLCDGGGEAWGIEYDPTTNTLSGFETNAE